MLSCQGCRVVTHAVVNLGSLLPRGARPGSAHECVGDLCGPLRRWLPWRQALGAACIRNGRAVEAERGSNPEGGGVLREQLSHVDCGGVGGQSRVATSGTASRAVTLLDLAGLRASGAADPAGSPPLSQQRVIGFQCFVSRCGVSFF